MTDAQKGLRTIVYATNAADDQPWVLEAAAHLAKETGARVAVVSVDEIETEMLSSLPRGEHQRIADEAATRAVDSLREDGVEVTKTVLTGPAIEQILAFADQQDADLIVVGSSTRSRLAARLLGSVPLSLVQRSRRPVLVVTEPERS
jgi:nucleotide-binding universal stress UspA family protein